MTQFCFNNKAILQWLQRISKVGIEQPVYIGITGPAKLKTLLRYSTICGISTSAAQFIKQPKLMWNLFFKAKPDYFINTLIKQPEIQKRVAGFHLFPFGGVDETIQWVENFSISKKTPTKTISKIIRKFLYLLDLSLNKKIQSKSIRVGLIVGLLLNIINNGGDFLGGINIEYLKVGLTFLTPYCVSIYSLVSDNTNKFGKHTLQ